MFENLLNPPKFNISEVGWTLDFLSQEDCDKVEKYCAELVTSEGSIDAGLAIQNYQQNSDIRESKVGWLAQSQETERLYKMVADFVRGVNQSYYGFRLNGFEEKIQYAEYPEGHGHYDWHLDIGPKANFRKLSLVIQLSDPESYEGGELQIMKSKTIDVAPRKRGAIVVFPSFILHRVTPVTKGVRKSLAIWISGPPFA